MTSENDLWPDEFTDSAGTTKLQVCPGPAGSAALVMTVGFRSVRLELPPAELPRLTRSLHKACGQPDPIVLARPEIEADTMYGPPAAGWSWVVGACGEPGKPVRLTADNPLTAESARSLAGWLVAYAELDPEPDPAVVAVLEARGCHADTAAELARALAQAGLLKDGES